MIEHIALVLSLACSWLALVRTMNVNRRLHAAERSLELMQPGVHYERNR